MKYGVDFFHKINFSPKEIMRNNYNASIDVWYEPKSTENKKSYHLSHSEMKDIFFSALGCGLFTDRISRWGQRNNAFCFASNWFTQFSTRLTIYVMDVQFNYTAVKAVITSPKSTSMCVYTAIVRNVISITSGILWASKIGFWVYVCLWGFFSLSSIMTFKWMDQFRHS